MIAHGRVSLDQTQTEAFDTCVSVNRCTILCHGLSVTSANSCNRAVYHAFVQWLDALGHLKTERCVEEDAAEEDEYVGKFLGDESDDEATPNTAEVQQRIKLSSSAPSSAVEAGTYRAGRLPASHEPDTHETPTPASRGYLLPLPQTDMIIPAVSDSAKGEENEAGCGDGVHPHVSGTRETSMQELVNYVAASIVVCAWQAKASFP